MISRLTKGNAQETELPEVNRATNSTTFVEAAAFVWLISMLQMRSAKTDSRVPEAAHT